MRVLDLVDQEDVRRMTEVQLTTFGVRIVDRQKLTLQCMSCAHTWTPELDADGKLPVDYWLCPEKCNE